MSGEEFNSNQKQNVNAGMESLEQMPSWSEHMQAFNETGENDEQEEPKSEKMEQIDSFEKRLEMNSPLYDNLAKTRAFVLALCPEARLLGTGQGSYHLPGGDYGGWKEGINPIDNSENAYSFVGNGVGRVPKALLEDKEALNEYNKKMSVAYLFRSTMTMMYFLHDGVTSDKENGLTVHTCKHLGNRETHKPFEVAINEKRAEQFEKAALGYVRDLNQIGDNWEGLENVGYTREEIDEAMEKAEELMDGERYEWGMDRFLRQPSDDVSVYDIHNVEETVKKLNSDTGEHMFNFTWDGSYAGDEADGDGFVPDMKTRYRLEEKILKTKAKILKTVEHAYKKEYEDMINRSRQGREALERIENE